MAEPPPQPPGPNQRRPRQDRRLELLLLLLLLPLFRFSLGKPAGRGGLGCIHRAKPEKPSGGWPGCALFGELKETSPSARLREDDRCCAGSLSQPLAGQRKKNSSFSRGDPDPTLGKEDDPLPGWYPGRAGQRFLLLVDYKCFRTSSGSPEAGKAREKPCADYLGMFGEARCGWGGFRAEGRLLEPFQSTP
ncbi:hypothetical protein E2320_015009 [Naja naja]|nr:hypothetical protein E2320_015009 [Naja naja]